MFDFHLINLCFSLRAVYVSRHHGLRGAKGKDGCRCGGSGAVAQTAGGEVPAGQAVHPRRQNLSGRPGGYSGDHAGSTGTLYFFRNE